MRRHPALTTLLVAPLLVLFGALFGTPAAAEGLTFERIFSDPPLEGRAPMQLKLSPDGSFASFLMPSAEDSEVLDLWGARLPDGATIPLVATRDLLGSAEQRLTEQERMALERRRITRRGITSYSWCGAAGEALLFPLSGDLYLARLDPAGGKPTVTRLTRDPEAPELSPVCDRAGAQVAWVKGGEVEVHDLQRGRTRRVTRGASETRTFGLAEFVAEEEMGRHEGMWWSPDGRRLLVLEVDEAAVSVKRRAQIFATRTELVEQRYPAAGEANAVVRALLFEARGGRGVPIALPTEDGEDGYVARAGFFPDGAPWVQWQSRDQRRLVLLEADARGRTRVILEEEDAAWVELHDDLRTIDGGRTLLWSTEASGRRQLVRVDRASGRREPLTDEPEAVRALLAVNAAEGLVYYSAWRDRGRQLRVFAMPLRGVGAGAQAQELTPEPGWHEARFDKAGRFFVDSHSDFMRPPRTVVRDAKGRIVVSIDDNPAEELRALPMPEARWMDVEAEDGTILNGLLLKPAGAPAGAKLPVIAYVYGGPGAQTVVRAWRRTWLPLLAWTHRGFGVFLLDNRGMAGRDRAFTRAHHQRFGEVELADQRRGYEALRQVPWVDPARVGIFGWSYGGYLAAGAALSPDTPFAAAAAVAPVTDWTLYDTHYTERYIGMPGEGEALSPAYARSDLTRRAADLSTPLLLVHGTADDNVLFDHTLRLIEALQEAGKGFELMIYPGKAHGLAGRSAQRHVWRTLTAFFEGRLAGAEALEAPAWPLRPPSP